MSPRGKSAKGKKKEPDPQDKALVKAAASATEKAVKMTDRYVLGISMTIIRDGTGTPKGTVTATKTPLPMDPGEAIDVEAEEIEPEEGE